MTRFAQQAISTFGAVEVPTRVVDSITTASTQLIAERDENTCRLDMKPSEAARLGMAIEGLDADQRYANQVVNLKQNRGEATEGLNYALGKAARVIGPAVGMSDGIYTGLISALGGALEAAES